MKRMMMTTALSIALAAPALAADTSATRTQVDPLYGDTLKQLGTSIERGDQGSVNIQMAALLQMLGEKATPATVTKMERPIMDARMAEVIRSQDERAGHGF